MFVIEKAEIGGGGYIVPDDASEVFVTAVVGHARGHVAVAPGFDGLARARGWEVSFL